MPWLINPAQLDKFRKSQKNVVIFDASFHMPDDHRNAQLEFEAKHIVDAQFFPIDALSDPNSELAHSHMLLQDEVAIAEKLGALGIRNDSKIIFYDTSKLHSSCRAVWMMKVFGHNPQQLYILDGGLEAWDNYGGKSESGQSSVSKKIYKTHFQHDLVKTLSQMKSNLHNPSEQVLDVRHAVRFAGGPELNPQIRLGHIPGSFSFPYITFFEKNGQWRPLEKIKNQLLAIGVDLKTPIISTCGSAITAPILNFFLDLIEVKNHAVYNGSWNEWGSEKLYTHELSLDERPIEDCFKE
jgi:thiosulfate/3-mercaptopyruvate sulfurtransferase